ncbi:MAG: ThuA domain-containing protein [Verrucomicrobiota bacterium]
MKKLLPLIVSVWLLSLIGSPAAPLVYEGSTGPGKDKHIVFIANDHNYRSQESLTALARILAKHHGFKCTVLFGIDPKTGIILPGESNIPAMENLKTADLLVLFARFQNLPQAQMQHFVDYLDRAGPIVALRTSTHAFKIPQDAPFAKYSYDYPKKDYLGGFGRQVLGETWNGHHGKNNQQSTRLPLIEEKSNHPILRGVKDMWVPSGGYFTAPTEDCKILAMAQPLNGMQADSKVASELKAAPGAWTRTYQGKNKTHGRTFTSTYGASDDILNEGYRRMLINACFWAAGLEEKIQAKADISLVGPYHPTWLNAADPHFAKPETLSSWDSPIGSLK